MAGLEIVEITKPPLNFSALYGGNVEQPIAGPQGGDHTLLISGWVLGREQRVSAVEIVAANRFLRVELSGPRPDIVAGFPGAPGAESSGFRTTFPLLGLGDAFTVEVRAVLENQGRISLASIRVRRTPLQTPFEPRLQPLLVTTAGRTGSTWVTLLLASHPQIVTHRPLESDTRVASYWLSILRSLSDPSSYLQMLVGQIFGEDWWIGNMSSERQRWAADWYRNFQGSDPKLFDYVAGDAVGQLAAFCQERIDSFYQTVAREAGQTGGVYFAEKLSPGPFVPLLVRELYPRSREVFLVRDPRDILCSMMAFDRQREVGNFGTTGSESMETYIRGTFRSTTLATLHHWKHTGGRAYLLRYEDLMLRPEESLSSVFNYLQLESSPALLEQIFRDARNRRSDLQAAHQTSRGPAASVGRWKNDLDPALRAVCEEVVADFLTEFGYD